MLHHGYVVAEGGIAQVRSEIRDRPYTVRIACDGPARLAARLLDAGAVTSVRLGPAAAVVETFDMSGLCRLVQALAAEGAVAVEGLDLADENVQAVYDYLIGGEGAPS